MVNDPLSDFINQIRNASIAGKDTILVPYSKLKFAVGKVLEKEGYVAGVLKKERKIKKFIEIIIRYDDKSPRITKAERVSKPSRRVYYNVGDITPIQHGRGILLLSTPKGIITGDKAVKEGVGGEALFKIW